MEATKHTYEQLVKELEQIRQELEEATDTIEAIRTGQVDALILQGEDGHELYTLKSADQTYRLFIEKMTEGALTINKEGIILYCNTQFATMVGQALNHIIGLPFSNFIGQPHQNEYAELLQKCWEQDCKSEMVLNNKKNTPIQLSVTTLALDEGLSLSVILTDLTQLKENQQQLKAKNEELEQMNHALEASNHDLLQFASVASHDLQEPLRKIQVFANLLKSREAHNFNDTSKMYVDKVEASAERMKQLIIDVLNYSKLSADNTVIEKTNLNALISDLLSDYEILIQEKEAVIEVGDMPDIEVNKGQIRQVFQNIISNAIKFSKKNKPPVIKITSELVSKKAFDVKSDSNGQYCKISIKDNGIGFEEKYVRNIFSLFERLNTKDDYEGSGIGLAIAKKIIEKHQGLITANSKPGAGSEFTIVLPVSQSLT